MDKLGKILMCICTISFLSGCVTQSFENDKDTPVIQNDSTNKEIAMTRISLGLGYLKMGNTIQAKLNLEKAKRFSPNLIQVHTAFAHYYDMVNEPELAILSYKEALTINGKDADTLNNFGVFLCKQKRYDEAEQEILKAIAVPSYILVAQSYQNIALCQLKAKNFVKAEFYLNKAIVHNPSSGSSLLHMVQLQYAKGQYQAAEKYLKRYEKATRRFSANALALAFKVYTQKGNKKIARNYAGMLLKMFPNAFETKQYLLNELEEIEADKLAKDYQQTQLITSSKTKKKKRVIVLSPNNMAPQSITPSNDSPSKPRKNQTASNEALNQSTPKPQSIKVVNNKSGKLTVAQAAKIETDKLKAIQRQKTISKLAIKPADKAKGLQMNSNENTLPVHVVTKGENLFSISKKYNIRMKSIEKWNSLHRSSLINIGDVIYLAEPKSRDKS